MSDFVKKVHFAQFKIRLGDHNRPWASHKVCRRCEEDIRLWLNCIKNSFRFSIPMIWSEQQNHTFYCYFCSVVIKSFNMENKNKISYLNLK